MILKFLFSVAALPTMLTCAHAQSTPAGCVQWKTYTDTVWVEQPVTENRVVSETSYEVKEITKSRPRWISEQRERTVTEEKPVEQTSERIVTRTVRKPVTTTKSRIKTRVEESYEDVTEMRDETYTVRKPVVETVIEKKEVRVRKPVTRRVVEKENVTVYRPVETTETKMVPGALVVPGYTGGARTRMKWLPRGYYGDPYTGQPVWRRPGLHWVNEPNYGQNAVPVVVPQQQSTVNLVPQTIVEEKPVDVTTYVDEYETLETPVTRERIVEETRTRKVPYTVRIPKRKIIEEEIPYTETTYVDETITERVPYTETVMKTVTRREPYTQIKESWEDYTETIRVPKTTTKRVPYVTTYRVPYKVEVRVPCDANGRPVARGQQVPGTHRLHPAWESMMTKVVGADSIRETSERSGTSVLDRGDSPARFDVPGSVEAPASASSVMASEVRSEREPLGEAPQNLQFENRSNPVSLSETSRRLKTIGQPKAEPTVAQPPETEASKEMARRIKERFRKLGIGTDTETASPESVETVETSADESARDLKVDLPPPARATFQPEPLTVDVDVPAAASQPAIEEPDAENSDDDTIERDVKLSRPSRT
ncbi:hypothetical protein [Mariniblastus fucicola]|nr:hypothetical protein [Mariniblastus fucicola]